MNNGVGESESQLIYSVSQLTDKIKALLEDSFPFVWITGEISNFSSPMSGHFYFSLKDDNAQISAVMFRGQNRNLRFEPKNGMSVNGLGRISLYKPRGTYQIIFEFMEPQGVGALQVAFEQLKARLSDEGLFDEERKKPLPFLPQKIALITSPTGAVLQDMIKVTRRRFENMHLLLVPVRVQGPGAIEDIVQAIDSVNRFSDADVAILARGGGSLEDLQAFNSEPVARAIVGSGVPMVSAVGHETDYTICDFVADLRAPTPSAAAEMVVPEKSRLLKHLTEIYTDINRYMDARIRTAASDLNNLSNSLVDPVKKIQDMAIRCDEMSARLLKTIRNRVELHRERLHWRQDMLRRVPLLAQIGQYDRQIENAGLVLRSSFVRRFDQLVSGHNTLHEKLATLSPLSVLDRGYSITRTAVEKQIVTRSKQVDEGQLLEIILSKGGLEVSVSRKTDPNVPFN